MSDERTFEDFYMAVLKERALRQGNAEMERYGLRPGKKATPAEFAPIIQQAAQRYNVDPMLVDAIIQVESAYKADAVSHAGAQGLMQLMPKTAASLGVRNAFDPTENIHAGARLIGDLTKKYKGNLKLALAAYNAGEGAVDRHGGIPPYAETQAYVPKVLSKYQTGTVGTEAPPQPAQGRIEPGALGAMQEFMGQPALGPKPQPVQAVAQPLVRDLKPAQISGVPGGKSPRGTPFVDVGFEDPGTIERALKGFARGLTGVGGSMLRTPANLIEGITNNLPTDLKTVVNMTPLAAVSNTLQEAGNLAKDWEQSNFLPERSKGFMDKLAEGAGSMAAFWAPAIATGGLMSAASATAPSIAAWAGMATAGIATVTESFTEANDVYEALKPLVGIEEASKRAGRVLSSNILLLGVTNALGPAGSAATPLRKVLAGVVGETLQEVVQYDQARRQFWVPSSHKSAQTLLAQGWVQDNDRVMMPFEIQDAATAGLIGGILGGGTAFVDAVARDTAGMRQAAGQAGIAMLDTLPEGNVGAVMGALRNERGSIGRPEGQPSPEQTQMPGMEQPTTFKLPPELAQAKPKLGTIPLAFQNDFDKALYIVGDPKKQSFRHDRYMQMVMDQLNVPEREASVIAERRRNEIVGYVRQHGIPGTPIDIPAQGAAQPADIRAQPDVAAKAGAEQADMFATPAPPTTQQPSTEPPGPVYNITEPPVTAGMVRFYHGGYAGNQGERWFSPDRAYAEGYAARNAGYDVFYIDIPDDSPLLVKSFDDSGTGMKAPYKSFEADVALAQSAKNLTNVQGVPPAQTAPKQPRQSRQQSAPVVNPYTMPTIQTEMPLRGAETQDMQGMPLIDDNAMRGLRDFLHMIEGERAEMLEIEGKPLEINYAHLDTDAGVKQILAAMSDIHAEAIADIRTPKSHEVMRKAALNSGMTIEQFLRLPRDQIVNRKNAILGREMAVASARQLKVGTAMFRSGSMNGRELLRLFAVHSAIQMQFARLANEAGGSLSEFAAPVSGDPTSLRGFEQIMEYLGQQNVSDELLATLIENTPTPEQLTLMVEQAPPVLFKDVFLSLWYGTWLLSNPKTFIVNAISTALAIPTGVMERKIAEFMPGRMSLETSMRRALAAKDTRLTHEQRIALHADAAAPFQRSVESGEAHAMLFSLFDNVGKAWKLAKQAAKTGESKFSNQRSAEGLETAPPQGGYHRVSEDIRGIRSINGLPVNALMKGITAGPLAYFWDALGAVAQTSSMGLMATDEFFKAMNYQMSLQALAWRKAMQDGMADGKSISQVMDEMQAFLTKPPEAARDLAIHEASERTFTRPLNSYQDGLMAWMGAGVQQAADKSPIMRLFVPFVRTGVNITYYNLERMPGINLFVKEVQRDMQAGGARRDLALARMSMGFMTGAAVMVAGALGLGMRGEGDPRRERRVLEEASKQQRYSWRIPWQDTFLSVSFHRLDPLSQSLGMLLDWSAAAEDVYASNAVDEWLEIGAAGLWALTKNITNRNYNQGLQDFFELVQNDENQDPETIKSRWEQFIQNQFARMVPAGIGALETALDPTMTEIDGIWTAFKSRLPFGEKVPRLDFWANPYKTPSVHPLVDIVNPFPIQFENMGPVTEELLEQRANIAGPSRFLLQVQRPQQGAEDQAVKLSPEAWNRLKTLFAKEVTDDSGLHLGEALAKEIASKEYRAKVGGPNSAKTNHLNIVIESFKKRARAAFEKEATDNPQSVQAEAVRQYRERQSARRSRTGEQRDRDRFIQGVGVQ